MDFKKDRKMPDTSLITIDLNLFATLSDKFTPGDCAFKIRDNATLAELMAQIGISEQDVKLIFVNGRKADVSRQLSSGDRVGLFPPVGGG